MGKPLLQLEGLRFHRLKVITLVGTRGGRTVWKCLCDCGTELEAVGSYLVRGQKKSCGCQKAEVSRSRNIKEIEVSRRFGRLVIKSEAGSNSRGYLLYACQCDCGAEVVTAGYHLRRGESRSCGCLRKDTVASLNKTHGLSGTKEYLAVASSKHRAKAAKVEGKHSAQDIRDIFSEQEGLCAYCYDSLGDRFHRDHKIPLSRGGSNNRENICLACPKCNRRKSDKTPEEFIASLQ